MTIEIRNAELEGLLLRHLTAGNFASVEDLLLQTLRDAPSAPGESTEAERRSGAFLAAERIRELRKGVTLGRPAGVSLREFAHIGHKH